MLRRAEIGTHHHITVPYLAAYADEMDWGEESLPAIWVGMTQSWAGHRVAGGIKCQNKPVPNQRVEFGKPRGGGTCNGRWQA